MPQEEFKHLQPESYYSDLYDRFTVEECRRMEKGLSKVEYKPETESDKKSKKKEIKVIVDLSPLPLYFLKGDRYVRKSETVSEWMARDQAKDDLLASVRPPEGIRCLACGSVLTPNFKNFHDGWPDKNDRVLFMYDCPNGCLPHRAFFNDGEEWRRKPHLCPKCNSEVDEKDKRKGNIITTTYACSKCGRKDKDILDLDVKPKPEKINPDFEKDRNRFCMSSEEGREYIEYSAKMKDISNLLKEGKEKEQIEKKLVGIKKLSVAGIRDLLSPPLEKEGYVKLEFVQPEISSDVIIQFNVQDSQSTREEYDSTHRLQKIIKSNLEKTNWRLMSEGIYYKLGILSGRLRGYEADEDLLKLVNQ